MRIPLTVETGKRNLPGEIQQLPSVLFSNDGHSRLQIPRVPFMFFTRYI